jgi:hypothetical protein
MDRRNLLRAWHDFSLEVLGHSGISITADVYVEVVDALKDDAAARLGGLLT